MTNPALKAIIARMDAAIERIERVGTLRYSAPVEDSMLQEKHDHLRRETLAAIASIDELIDQAGQKG